MAAEWGMPPWEIEERVPALWYDRFVARRDAQASAQPKEIKPGSMRL